MSTVSQKTNLSQHILPNSSTMIGVCMTVISITKVVGLHHAQRGIAELLAFDALIFLLSALFSYFSMRHERETQLSVRLEKVADVAFMIGLTIMTLTGFLLTYELV